MSLEKFDLTFLRDLLICGGGGHFPTCMKRFPWGEKEGNPNGLQNVPSEFLITFEYSVCITVINIISFTWLF